MDKWVSIFAVEREVTTKVYTLFHPIIYLFRFTPFHLMYIYISYFDSPPNGDKYNCQKESPIMEVFVDEENYVYDPYIWFIWYFGQFFVREGLKKKIKKLAFDQKGGGGWRKNQLANFIFYFSTNNEYGI